MLQDSQDGIVTLTLNRPNQYNALSAELLAALQTALDPIADDESVHAVIIAADDTRYSAYLGGHGNTG